MANPIFRDLPAVPLRETANDVFEAMCNVRGIVLDNALVGYVRIERSLPSLVDMAHPDFPGQLFLRNMITGVLDELEAHHGFAPRRAVTKFTLTQSTPPMIVFDIDYIK